MAMQTRLVLVTPTMAAGWLKRNTDNRRIRPYRVKDFVGMIQRGEWLVTHQGVAFGPSGRLLDGQHRLLAIVEAGVAVQMLVSTDVDEAAYLVMDTGEKRSVADALHISVHAAGLANFLVRIDKGSTIGQITALQSSEYLAPFNDTHNDLLEFCSVRGRYWGSSPVRAAAVLRIYGGGDADYVKLQYRALNLADFSLMSPITAALYRSVAQGRVKPSNGALSTLQMFARAERVFEASRSGYGRVQIADVSHSVEWARGVIHKALGGAPPAANRPSRSAAATKWRANHQQARAAQ